VPSDKKRVVLETAMSEQLLSDTAPGAHPQRGPGEALRVIYTGRLVGIKYIPAALHAVAIAKASGVAVNLVLVGDGPDRATLERLAANLGISGSVTFTGSLPHADVLGRLRESDVYLFPSLKEGGVWSLLEAMAAGLAVVCLKSSGMAVITDDTSAVRVDPTSPQAVIDAMGQSLIQLANDPARRLELGRCARRRVEEHFRWEHKGTFLQRLFEELERPAIS
jgi:glycosyltransferase involved in cell wall biosynthesis